MGNSLNLLNSCLPQQNPPPQEDEEEQQQLEDDSKGILMFYRVSLQFSSLFTGSKDKAPLFPKKGMTLGVSFVSHFFYICSLSSDSPLSLILIIKVTEKRNHCRN